MATVGMAGLAMLLKVQTMRACALTLIAGMVRTLAVRLPNAVLGLPEAAKLVSTHEAVLMVKLVAAVSVIVTAVPVVDTAMGISVVG